MSKAYLDSAYPPNDAQCAAAVAAGYSGWNGYFAGPNILNGWGKAHFDRVKGHGLATMAYCSGWASAVAMRAQGAAWGVTPCLDVEGGIRALVDPADHAYLAAARGRMAVPEPVRRALEARQELEPAHVRLLKSASAWIQPWLDAAAAGVYGNYWIHPGLRSRFYVLAAYPAGGDSSSATWWSGSARPAGLCGWQFQGSHNFNGITVDSSWFDDALDALLRGSTPPPPQEDDMLYVGSFHPMTASLKAFAAGSYYLDPIAAAEVRGGDVTVGSVYDVLGYVYSSSAVQSPDVSPAAGNQPGPDKVWWLAKAGGWVPDAYLVTAGLAGAPGPLPPAGEQLRVFAPAGPAPVVTGVTQAQVDSSIGTALAQLAIVRKPAAEPET